MSKGQIYLCKMPKVRNNIGSKSTKVEMSLNHKVPSSKWDKTEMSKVRNDIGTKCPKVEMIFGKIQNNIKSKSAKVEVSQT